MRRALPALLWAACAALLGAKGLLEVRGDYLLYSYDYNFLYGQGAVVLQSPDWTIRAGTVEIDVSARAALAGRGCRVTSGGREVEADLLAIDLETLTLTLFSYGENVRSWTLPGTRKPPPGAAAAAPGDGRFQWRELAALKGSLLYFLGKHVVISNVFRVYGYQTTAFIEGGQSLSFKRFSLDRGIDTSKLQGVWADRVWYYASQGIVANTHFLLERPVPGGTARSANSLDVMIDPFGQVEYGPALRLNFNSRNSFSLTRRHEAGVDVEYLTDNLLRAGVAFRSQWTPRLSSELALEYSRTAAAREELWLRLRSRLQDPTLGEVALDLGGEKEGQYQGSVSLRNQALKNVSVSLQHSFSRLLFNEDLFNRRRESSVSLAYTHRLFQLGADYSFHRDLLQDQSQGTPRFTLKLTPFRLYGGLLRADFISSFLVNRLTLAGRRDQQSRANLTFHLQSEALELGPGSTLTVALAAEQLLERLPQDRYTSLGCVLTCRQRLGSFADLELLYNFNSRRRTESWLIQGTTSQDWSALLRLRDNGQRVKGWASLSYDTKTGRFTSGYLDAAVSLVKNWTFQTQMHYDFLFRNFSYDLYLIRDAGRLQLRASYRSLSRRVLIELLPR